MHQQALDRDAALAVDQEHPPENGRDRRINIDVRQYDPGVIAAELEGQVLQRLGG